MLTREDVSIVRAAMQFLDEEFSLEDDELFQHYLDDCGVLAGVGTKHIKATRAKFDNADVYVAMKQLDRDELASSRLVPLSSAEEISYQSDRELPVSVIVTSD